MVSQVVTKRAFYNDGNVRHIYTLSNMVTTSSMWQLNLQHVWCDFGTF